ncbi:MAG: hypothetical protein ACI4TX_00905 [Christensenellales bacterium]
MEYFNEYKFCPICLKDYDKYPESCQCGYSAFKKDELEYDARLFKIYKYTKQVFFGLIPYEKSKLSLHECEDYTYIDDIEGEKRGLEYVDLVGEKKPTCVDEGLLAIRRSAVALILNCDYACSNFLDECAVKILFLGKDFKGFIFGGFAQICSLRYIYVDERNPFYEVRDNVLIDKRTMTIIAYPRDKKDEEYKVDNDINSISLNAFKWQENLKKVYVPHNLVINNAFANCDLEIIRY